MSHSVTVTRTTTTTTTSAILINTGYFKTYPGIVKLFELLIGIVVVGIVSHFYPNPYGRGPEVFLLVTAVACLLGTTCIVIGSILSISTASILPKTLFEVTFHSLAFVLYLAASITFLINVENYKNSSYRNTHYEPLLAAAILGLINAALYLISTVLSYRSYKGK